MVQTTQERKEEKEKLFKFILEQCDTADKPLNLKSLINEFVAKKVPATPARSLETFVSSHKATELDGMECTDTKIRRMFVLGLTIHRELLTKLKEHGTVTLDENKQITSYEAFDGTLTLSGKHDTKSKMSYTVDRRNQMAANEAGNEEEEAEDVGDRLGLAVDPELHPPAPRRPRVESPANDSEARVPPTNNSSGNLPGPGVENVKEEVPEQDIKNFDASQMNVAKTEEPDTNVAPNPATPRQSRSAAPTWNLPTSLPAAPGTSIASQSLAATSVVNRTVTIATQIEILKQLEIIIGIMNLPMDPSEIRDHIQKIESEEGEEKLEKLEMEDVKKTIRYSIMVAKRKQSEGEKRSLKRFLQLLQFVVVKEGFEQIEKDLKQQLEALKLHDTLVPVTNITKAMEAMMDTFVSN